MSGAYDFGFVEERMAATGTPALSLAVIRDGEVALARTWGVREAGKPEPIDERTIFQAGSISKFVTCVGVLRLVDQGKLDLDRDVNDYLTSWQVPSVEGWQPRLTLRMLMSHTAGLTVHGFPGYNRSVPVPTVPQLLNGEPPANTPAVRNDVYPRTRWRYSGGGTTVMQLALTDHFKRPFADLLRALVLEPAGMRDATFEQPLPEARWKDAAQGHRDGTTVVEGGWHVYPEIAAAGLWCTPTDLCRFAIAFQKALAGEPGALLPVELAREAVTPPAPSTDVGLGPFIESGRFGHGGGDEGFLSNLAAGLEGGFGYAVMVNSLTGGPMLGDLMNAVAVADAWPGYAAKAPPITSLAELLALIAGRYRSSAGVVFEIAADEQQLTVAGPGQAPLALQIRSLQHAELPGFRAWVDFEWAGEPGAAPPAAVVFRQPGASVRAERAS